MNQDPRQQWTLESIGRLVQLRWRFLAAFAATGGCVAAVLVLILPRTYEARATLIPVTSPGLAPRIGAVGIPGLTPDVVSDLTGVGSASLAFPDILTSRTALEGILRYRTPARPPGGDSTTILQALRLRKRAAPLMRYLATRKLRRMVQARVDRRSGLITIVVRANDPELAAATGNAAISELVRYNLYSRNSLARTNRTFIESRITETRRLLGDAEAALARFRERNLRIGNAPELLLQQERLAREVKVQEEIYLTLTREYEIAKIEERKETPVVSILDSAVPPPVPSGPGPVRAGAGGIVAGLGIGLVCLMTVPAGRGTRAPASTQ